MNLAVGGKFLKPDKTTAFPAEMVVDYVRVTRRWWLVSPGRVVWESALSNAQMEPSFNPADSAMTSSRWKVWLIGCGATRGWS